MRMRMRHATEMATTLYCPVQNKQRKKSVLDLISLDTGTVYFNSVINKVRLFVTIKKPVYHSPSLPLQLSSWANEGTL